MGWGTAGASDVIQYGGQYWILPKMRNNEKTVEIGNF